MFLLVSPLDESPPPIIRAGRVESSDDIEPTDDGLDDWSDGIETASDDWVDDWLPSLLANNEGMLDADLASAASSCLSSLSSHLIYHQPLSCSVTWPDQGHVTKHHSNPP